MLVVNDKLTLSLADVVKENIEKHPERGEIGVRKTPVISFWPMRQKWSHHGVAWMMYGTDGDTRRSPNNAKYFGIEYPDILRLTYIRCADGRVCQLATKIDHTELHDSLAVAYDIARRSSPQPITL